MYDMLLKSVKLILANERGTKNCPGVKRTLNFKIGRIPDFLDSDHKISNVT